MINEPLIGCPSELEGLNIRQFKGLFLDNCLAIHHDDFLLFLDGDFGLNHQAIQARKLFH